MRHAYGWDEEEEADLLADEQAVAESERSRKRLEVQNLSDTRAL